MRVAFICPSSRSTSRAMMSALMTRTSSLPSVTAYHSVEPSPTFHCMWRKSDASCMATVRYNSARLKELHLLCWWVAAVWLAEYCSSLQSTEVVQILCDSFLSLSLLACSLGVCLLFLQQDRECDCGLCCYITAETGWRVSTRQAMLLCVLDQCCRWADQQCMIIW